MKIEGVCPNNSCASVVSDAYGPRNHFRHWQLRSEADPVCVLCDMDLIIKRRVPDAHLFALGDVVATAGTMERLEESGEEAQKAMQVLIFRHVRGDWGTLDDEDWAKNQAALKNDVPPNRNRLFSAYRLKDDRYAHVWVITEAGRHETTLLLPEEY